MPIDPWWIMLQLVIGGTGFVLFTFGRRQERFPYLVAGLLFMVLPYFTTTAIEVLLGAVLLAVGTWWAVRMGW